MARPSKLTPETKAAIIEAISLGATYHDAAEAAGVAYNTLNEWLKAGEAASSGKFHDLYDELRRAEAQCRNNFVAVIAKAAASGDWRAAEAYLKRRDRANWGDAVETSGTVKVVLIDETEDE